jgi:hypothetical protein
MEIRFAAPVAQQLIAEEAKLLICPSHIPEKEYFRPTPLPQNGS